MTIGQIVKIVIAVLVIVAVILGVWIGFKNYIIPYFGDLGPSVESGVIGLYFFRRWLNG